MMGVAFIVIADDNLSITSREITPITSSRYFSGLTGLTSVSIGSDSSYINKMKGERREYLKVLQIYVLLRKSRNGNCYNKK